MAFIRWKFQSGRGPYAQIQEAYREGGRVKTRHVKHLGQYVTGPEQAQGSANVAWPGQQVVSPNGQVLTVPELKPHQLERLRKNQEQKVHKQTTKARPRGSLEAPETDVPTTDVPTTDVPTTDVPTTGVPTTGVPTTGVPTTSGEREDQIPDPIEARPHRLPDNTWGVMCPQGTGVGDLVTVTTARGNTWQARITEVVSQTDRGVIARSQSQGPPPNRQQDRQQGRQSQNRPGPNRPPST